MAMSAGTKRVLVVGGLALGFAGVLALAARKAKADPNTPPAPTPQGTWVNDASDPAVGAIANSISYNNSPVKWTDGQTYEQVIDGTRWRFIMSWQTCYTEPDQQPYQCKHVTTQRYVPPQGAGRS